MEFFLNFLMFFSLFYFITMIILAHMVIFTKAGVEGWKALIPVYNFVVLFNLTGRSGWNILFFFVPIFGLFVFARLVIEVLEKFGKGFWFAMGIIVFPLIFTLILAFGDAEYQG